ncbi:MAG: hypothetical protein AB1441_00305 [Bacillota bacterium]
MRTTIEIPDDKRAKLLAIAARRGFRGYSQIVNEALDLYLAKYAHARDADIKEILSLAGTLEDTEAREVENKIRKVWERWES